jgi:hypothetical protein
MLLNLDEVNLVMSNLRVALFGSRASLLFRQTLALNLQQCLCFEDSTFSCRNKLLYLDPMPNLEHVRSLSVIAQLPFYVDGDFVFGILNMSLVVQFLDIALSLTSKLFDRFALNAT